MVVSTGQKVGRTGHWVLADGQTVAEFTGHSVATTGQFVWPAGHSVATLGQAVSFSGHTVKY